MMKFKLHIFPPCQRKHSTSCKPHKTITRDSPPSSSKQTPHRSSFKTHVSSTFLGCGSGPKDFQTQDVVSPRLKISNSASFCDNKKCCNRPKGSTISPARFSKSFSDNGTRSRLHLSGASRGGQVSSEWGSLAKLSMFKKLMPFKMEGKVKESFVVVKRSEKPYEDFKKSMLEMIVENQIYDESDLKQLLQCFLWLNSSNHHGVIMKAFSNIRKTIFLNR